MNQAIKRQSISTSNPLTVLESIQASRGIANELGQQTTSDCPVSDRRSDGRSDVAGGDSISLRINPETTLAIEDPANDLIENQAESANQIQQLANRLNQNELELNRRTASLSQKIQAWNQTASDQKALHQKKVSQLQQQASQVRCQQLHLMQLQTDILKSYEATRSAIECLFNEDSDEGTSLAALKALKFELNGRFDFIARRWEHLAKLMQGLRDQELTRTSVEDSTDWSGHRGM